MKILKLKSFKQIRELGIFNLSVNGNSLMLKRKGSENSLHISLEYFDSEVLITEHTTLHPNLIRIVPEIVDHDTGVSFINKNEIKNLQDKVHIIEKVTEQKYSNKILELEEQLNERFAVKEKAKAASLKAQLSEAKSLIRQMRDKVINKDDKEVKQKWTEENKRLEQIGKDAYEKFIADNEFLDNMFIKED